MLSEQEEQEKLQAILRTVADVIITIDHTGTVIQVNQALEQQFGYTPAELTGRNISMLMPEPYASEHDGYLARYLRTDKAGIIGVGRELVAKHKNGSLFPIHLSVTKVEAFPFFVGVIRDMSELVKLEKETLLIGEQERNRISRELHDDLGQNLMGISMQLQGLTKQLAGTDNPLQHQLQQLSNELQQNVRNIRDVISELATIELEEQGLKDALKTFISSCNRYHKTPVNLMCEGEWQAEDYGVAVQLYRIAREAIYNALKHADASCIDVSLLQQPDSIRLVIQDNGKGFPPEITLRDSRLLTTGHGLRNIHFRAHVIGAHLTIRSSADTGTRIECLYCGLTGKAAADRIYS
ncbi:PAS domain S-box protein [Rheinheimera sp.]|uniref:sensor histidine kinase n=1 Tax=Rheinheimera sp. TaxID=1869214 RepID=UPI002736AF6D|nr:PAS domain S-box protein [Rheinheimera sp.]MDP2715473.1 PAS domain S-box protein [Rheinheimera sp.]